MCPSSSSFCSCFGDSAFAFIGSERILDAGWDDQSEGHVVLLGTHMLDT